MTPRRKRADAPCASCARLESIAGLQAGGLEQIAKIVEKGPHAFQMQEISKVLSTFLGREIGWKGGRPCP